MEYAHGEKNPTIYCFHFFFFFFFWPAHGELINFEANPPNQMQNEQRNWATTTSVALCCAHCTLFTIGAHTDTSHSHRRNHLHCRATALLLRCQWWPSFAARQRRSMNWAELLGRILFDFFEGGEGGRLCALNFGFVFISCVIFVSLQYKKEKQKTTSTPTKWRLLLAKKLWKQAKCNEMKKKVFRNGHQLYSKFFFFGLVWFFPKSESMQRLLRDF